MIDKVYKIVKKDWGEEIWIALNDKYCLKTIKISKGHRCSLQYHEFKTETTFIVSGLAKVWLKRKDETEMIVFESAGPGTVLNLKPGDVHRLEALEDLCLFEASTPEVWDVVRLSDDYNREGTSEP
ncbi:MAG: cupin [Candidatus Parcubacteria bacterium]|nr:cupin [Candidatus Parcubacteria bacterium]